MINIEDISIKIILKNSKTMLAQAEVIFFELLETKGWRIMESNKTHPKFQEYIWIQPPCYKTNNSYKPLLFINNKLLYEELEEKIYNAYSLKKIHEKPDGSESTIEEMTTNEIKDEIF